MQKDENAPAETRIAGLRAYNGQLERLLRENSIAIPSEVAMLNPDRAFPPAEPVTIDPRQANLPGLAPGFAGASQ